LLFRKYARPHDRAEKTMKYEAEVLKTNKTYEMKQSDLIQMTFLLGVDFLKAIPCFGNFRVCY